MGMDDFAPYLKINGCFVVLNTSPQVKTIKIFNYPILYGQTRDILQIPGVAEADIRASLLKGELNHKIRAKDIIVICSDIDLLQFNERQKLFLRGAGIQQGLQVGYSNLNVVRREDIQLIGNVNGINTIYTIPDGIFLYNSKYTIIAYLNGVKQALSDDYFISESGGPGTGYDTITFIVPPSPLPLPIDVVTADYYINNP